MKKTVLIISMIALLLFQISAVCALSSSEARQDWLEAKQTRFETDAKHKQAKLDYAAEKTPENDQAVIDTAKEVLDATLDEAEAWLIWKKIEAQENPNVPDDIQNSIITDVEVNLAKIDDLRTDVENINTRADIGIVFLKMIGAYVELLTDVARNTGAMWVYIGEALITTAEDYEAKLRSTAEELENNDEIINKLNLAKSELETAKNKVNIAEAAYKKVIIPGTPLIKFAEGNNYLRQAKTNLDNATRQLIHAFNLIIAQ